MTKIRQAVEELAASVELPFQAGAVEVVAAPDVYGSPFFVGDAAVIAVTAATWAVSVLDGLRSGQGMKRVRVDARHAAATFSSERLLLVPALGGEHLWDAITGNYRVSDGWVRLHANVAAHRAAVLQVLGVGAEREAVAAASAAWRARELEEAVLEAGGVAARMRTLEQWQVHPQREEVLLRPVIDLRVTAPQARQGGMLSGGRVLEGVRVLDLTRVIAGPVAGRFLASFGADVLRVDAPDLDDMLLFEIDTAFGKRRTSLDLREHDDRRVFESLLAGADVLLQAFRPGALARLGFDETRLQQLRPGLVTGNLSAYGSTGPWGGRRGFDSVVQVGCGIAHTCGYDRATGPSALPAQALDHACGYLLAAGVIAALALRERDGFARAATVSLARTAEWLTGLGIREGVVAKTLDARDVEDLLDWRAATAWGEVRHVRACGRVGDRQAHWHLSPAPRAPRRTQTSAPAWPHPHAAGPGAVHAPST